MLKGKKGTMHTQPPSPDLLQALALSSTAARIQVSHVQVAALLKNPPRVPIRMEPKPRGSHICPGTPTTPSLPQL